MSASFPLCPSHNNSQHLDQITIDSQHFPASCGITTKFSPLSLTVQANQQERCCQVPVTCGNRTPPPPDRQHWQSLTSVAITNFTNDLIPPRHNNCEKRELPVLQVLASPHNFLGLITPQSEYISQNRSASFILCFLSQNIILIFLKICLVKKGLISSLRIFSVSFQLSHIIGFCENKNQCILLSFQKFVADLDRRNLCWGFKPQVFPRQFGFCER